VHQVGDQPRLYYNARSTNHQDSSSCSKILVSSRNPWLRFSEPISEMFYSTVTSPVTLSTHATFKYILARAQGRRSPILTLFSKHPLLVILGFSANMLAIFSPNCVSPSNSTRSHVKRLIFLSDI